MTFHHIYKYSQVHNTRTICLQQTDNSWQISRKLIIRCQIIPLLGGFTKFQKCPWRVVTGGWTSHCIPHLKTVTTEDETYFCELFFILFFLVLLGLWCLIHCRCCNNKLMYFDIKYYCINRMYKHCTWKQHNTVTTYNKVSSMSSFYTKKCRGGTFIWNSIPVLHWFWLKTKI